MLVAEIICFVAGILLVLISVVIFQEISISTRKDILFPPSIVMIAIICMLCGPIFCVFSTMDYVESKKIPTSIAVYRNQTELEIRTKILNGDTVSNDTIVIWKDKYKPYK